MTINADSRLENTQMAVGYKDTDENLSKSFPHGIRTTNTYQRKCPFGFIAAPGNLNNKKSVHKQISSP